VKVQNIFLATECFFLLVPGVFSSSNKSEQLEFKWKQLLGFRNMQEKLEKSASFIVLVPEIPFSFEWPTNQ
jgi:hypothetical protein